MASLYLNFCEWITAEFMPAQVSIKSYPLGPYNGTVGLLRKLLEASTSRSQVRPGRSRPP